MTMTPREGHGVSRRAVTRALEAAEVGDYALVVDILLVLVEEADEPPVTKRVVCSGCGQRFEWPGALHAHQDLCYAWECRAEVGGMSLPGGHVSVVRETLEILAGTLNRHLRYDTEDTLEGLRYFRCLFAEMAMHLDSEIERIVEEQQTQAAGIASDPREVA